MTPSATQWRFGPVQGPVVLDGCSELIEPIKATLNGWHVEPWPPGGPPTTPAIAITRRDNDFILTSPTIKGEDTYDNVPYIVCAFMAELIMAYGAARPDMLFLHSGAAMVGGRLIVFPAKGKTGKSTLSAQIARRGGRIFSDDVVPVNIGTARGMALGIQPRLRLPLPDGTSPEMRAWVENHQRLVHRKMTYLALPRQGAGSIAPLGEERAIDAFVMLTREPGMAPVLEPCPRSDIMKLLIRQHFGANAPVARVVERFKALVESAPCYRLLYSGGEEAPDLLDRLEKAA